MQGTNGGSNRQPEDPLVSMLLLVWVTEEVFTGVHIYMQLSILLQYIYIITYVHIHILYIQYIYTYL